jgi:hypothetical protein
MNDCVPCYALISTNMAKWFSNTFPAALLYFCLVSMWPIPSSGLKHMRHFSNQFGNRDGEANLMKLIRYWKKKRRLRR